MFLEDGDHRVVRVDALRDGGGAGLAVGPVPVPPSVASLVRTVPPVRSSPPAPSAAAITT